jgi:hypothetical protein
LCRVPLAIALGKLAENKAAPIVSGDKNHHGGLLKASQFPASICAFEEILGYAGVELLAPLRAGGALCAKSFDIDFVSENIGDLTCMFSQNYKMISSCHYFDMARHDDYISGFMIPAGKAIIDAWERVDYRRVADIDYIQVVADAIA